MAVASYPSLKRTVDLDDANVIHILWAAMVAMVHDIHAPQDQLSPEQLRLAGVILGELDAEMEMRT